MYKELLLGAGASRNKRVSITGESWQNLTTLDINPDHQCDVTWDLNVRPLPFKTSCFDEIHAYEILEHVGKQGDYINFFEEWNEYGRILKPLGLFILTSPKAESQWLWGDPSHTRAILPATLTFLSQKQYEGQIGNTAMADYRYLYTADFEAERVGGFSEESWYGILRNKK